MFIAESFLVLYSLKALEVFVAVEAGLSLLFVALLKLEANKVEGVCVPRC